MMSKDHSIDVSLESADARFALLGGRKQHSDESDAELVERALRAEYGPVFEDERDEYREELSPSEQREADRLRDDLNIF